MPNASWLLVWTMLVFCASVGQAGAAVYEYPSAVLDAHGSGGHCWQGMDPSGYYPVPVALEPWLIGAPPSEESGVTLPTSCWVDLAFSGRLVNGDGNDLTLLETGKSGEQALIFITDGADQEYLLARASVPGAMVQELSRLEFDLERARLPFVPRAVRVVALDLGGLSPGFDLNSMLARVSHDCGEGNGAQARCPNPVSGAAAVGPPIRLTWTPGDAADRHVVYFGESAAAVRAGRAEVRYPEQPRDANTFEPSVVGLGRTYCWRVDETAGAESETLSPGDVWSFTVTDRLLIDDFEAYDLRKNFLYQTWESRGRAGVSLEQGIVRSCRQALSFRYHYDAVWPSEVFRAFEEPQDWVRIGARVLQLMVRGTAGNATQGRMVVILRDHRTEQQVPYGGDLGLLAEPRWHACRIALADFHEIDLANVTGIGLGFCTATTDPRERGAGTIYLDDITLHPSLCLEDPNSTDPAEFRLEGDLTADCAVNQCDLERLAEDWLYDSTAGFAVAAPNEPVLWYEFEDDARDRAGLAHGQILGRTYFGTGVQGRAIHFAGPGDAVVIPAAPSVFARTREALTIAFWQRGDDSTHLNDTICCSNYIHGRSDPALAIHLGCWRNPGQYRWDCGWPWSFANRLAGRHRDKSEWTGRWNHWAFTKDIRVAGPDGRKGRMEIYLNGVLYDRRTGTDTPITGITSFEIGSGWYGHYDGMIDDFRIYDYALSAAEIAHVATRGTGIFPQRSLATADLNADGAVNLDDFALLATRWLTRSLWP
ncbi:MAG: hypothetical protein MUC88_23645 [Planctomycetes bacterium]|jgi:hypothetical protein|nr:hypothetical protein [Planctomycetota bacterium]